MLTDINASSPELWGGIECTINRINDTWRDQLEYAQHYNRADDIDKIAALGIKALRYPLLWELHEPLKDQPINWQWAEKQLNNIREKNIIPIAGLLHHGSGPGFTDLADTKFPEHLAAYAKKAATQFPWIEYYTPINEPLTTARFSGLYGLWYPHKKEAYNFILMLIHQLKATVLSMQEIRKINPSAKLIQTEDLAKIHSTPTLKYQTDFENERRWLTYDILCGKVDEQHFFWKYFINLKIDKRLLYFFIKNPCPPDIIGCNYYVTSERYLDENISCYPTDMHCGNNQHKYVDIAAVHAIETDGLKTLLKETWQRYNIPIALTEVHLNCTREEQLRWFKEAWDVSCDLCLERVPIVGVTAWSILGAYDWNSLLTKNNLHYETGVFEINNNKIRGTAIAKMVTALAKYKAYHHPLLTQKGWWHKHYPDKQLTAAETTSPVLIFGGNGTLGNALIRICKSRSIPFISLTRKDADITNKHQIESVINLYKPWAIINATGYVQVDNAESHKDLCFDINVTAATLLAKSCNTHNIRYMMFSSDLVFNGDKQTPYIETDIVCPLNIYGESKAKAESLVLHANPDALIIRTSAFFGPWDTSNFAWHILNAVKENKYCPVVNDVVITPTYVPDLVNAALDIFIDEENGIWHISNDGSLSWMDFGNLIVEKAGYNKTVLQPRSVMEMEWKAKRPLNSALQSKKGLKLPALESAIGRFFDEKIV